MPVLTTLVLALTITGSDGASCAAPTAGCSAEVAATCQPCSPCASAFACMSGCDSYATSCNGCGNPCCSFCQSGCTSKACRHSTCTLYPHYAYFPECHGYYYFTPYNWVHIDQHRMTIPGQNFKNPYSNAVFDRLYAGRENTGDRDSDQPKAIYPQLPKLEALLK